MTDAATVSTTGATTDAATVSPLLLAPANTVFRTDDSKKKYLIRVCSDITSDHRTASLVFYGISHLPVYGVGVSIPVDNKKNADPRISRPLPFPLHPVVVSAVVDLLTRKGFITNRPLAPSFVEIIEEDLSGIDRVAVFPKVCSNGHHDCLCIYRVIEADLVSVELHSLCRETVNAYSVPEIMRCLVYGKWRYIGHARM